MRTPSRRRFAFTAAAFAAALATTLPALAHDDGSRGLVFSSSNATGGNELLVFAGTNGSFALAARVSTQGVGTGTGLGSQGAVTTSRDGRYVFVVNAASNSVSTFALRGNGATLVSVVDSGGLRPISVAEHDGIVYVLNADGAGNVAGFRNLRGTLQPLPNGTRGLSAAGGTAPAQVGFGADGDLLVVTEKATNRIVSWPVRNKGTLGNAVITASSGATPFGFAFDRRDHLIVSEAPGSAASSYRFDERDGAVPTLISASVPNTQAAACWAVVTPDGRYAYTANAGTNTLSAYRIARGGKIELVNAVAGFNGADSGATDMAVPRGGDRLYALASRSGQVVSYRVEWDGSLTNLGAAAGLVGMAGLAAN